MCLLSTCEENRISVKKVREKRTDGLKMAKYFFCKNSVEEVWTAKTVEWYQ